ncbi:MAG: hypothetical protein COB83_05110 [Gammaproteobacteria bacterium]|nr:MAG: hypothetical protein COB83_05110 [Gammaproteobacteria bacterium]
MKTKAEIITNYRNELKNLRDVYENSNAEYARPLDKSNARRKQELKLANEYLTKYPKLKDKDCSGRGLPAFNAKILNEYLNWQ